KALTHRLAVDPCKPTPVGIVPSICGRGIDNRKAHPTPEISISGLCLWPHKHSDRKGAVEVMTLWRLYTCRDLPRPIEGWSSCHVATGSILPRVLRFVTRVDSWSSCDSRHLTAGNANVV